jgi:ADP-dependent phosphofructokinase/glucokinase
MTGTDWTARYDALARRLPDLARGARPVLCGLGACVDVYLRLHEALPPLEPASRTPAGALARELLDRAARGVGGEVRIDWPEGPAWLDARLPGRLGLGGTGAQAAQTLAVLGAPTLLALPQRSARQLGRIHSAVRVAGPEGIVPVGRIVPSGPERPAHYIVEYMAGVPLAGIVPPRSSRVIVRFADDPIERDPWFMAESVALAPRAGAAILSGFNELPERDLAATLAWIRPLATRWRDSGLRLIHLELGDGPRPAEMSEVLEGLEGAVSSLGLSQSELDKLLPHGGGVAACAQTLAERFGLDRVAVHADHWALALTRDDPRPELEALMAGSLVAATRAWRGEIAVPEGCPPGAAFAEPPELPIAQRGAWAIACCATPYLRRPAATIGLGDTFLAGSLLVPSQPAARSSLAKETCA